MKLDVLIRTTFSPACVELWCARTALCKMESSPQESIKIINQRRDMEFTQLGARTCRQKGRGTKGWTVIWLGVYKVFARAPRARNWCFNEKTPRERGNCGGGGGLWENSSSLWRVARSDLVCIRSERRDLSLFNTWHNKIVSLLWALSAWRAWSERALTLQVIPAQLELGKPKVSNLIFCPIRIKYARRFMEISYKNI